MMNFNSISSLAIGWHIHMILGGVAIVGAILFILWANKNLSKNVLKNWAIWLLVIGIIGVLLTGGYGVRGFQSIQGFGPGTMMHLEDDEHEEIETAEEFREHMLEEMEEHMGF